MASYTTVAEWDGHYAAGYGWRPVIGTETALLEQHLGAGEGRPALDVACGTGGYAAALAALGWKMAGVDYAPTAITLARAAHPGIAFRVADIERDILDGAYALITCRLAYAFLDKAAFLARARRLLARGGALHITTPVACRLPDERRDIGITAVDDQQLRATSWAHVSSYDLDQLACYTLRRTEGTQP